eukprot:m.383861 g.383861  ORF g.383861 m.383861 type:complete len:128 (+) comp20985_c0_seq9:568-951(+)
MFQFRCILVLLLTLQANGRQSRSHYAPAAQRELPSRIVAGYASWGQCDEKLVQACRDGVNVLIWFAINLEVNPTSGKPEITGSAASGIALFDVSTVSFLRVAWSQVDVASHLLRKCCVTLLWGSTRG